MAAVPTAVAADRGRLGRASCGSEGIAGHQDAVEKEQKIAMIVFHKTKTQPHGERQTDEGKSYTKNYPLFSLFSCIVEDEI